MIHTNRVVTVGDQESIIDKPIVLYRGDREVEVEFELVGNEFMFTTEGNVIKSMNASHGQLVLNTPSGDHMFSEVAECHDGKVVFVITKEMIDEFIEIGFYSFQIRLYDGVEMKSRATIPPVFSGLDIRNPIAAEDETNVVDQAVVDYARIYRDQSNEELPTFTWDGAYNKTDWVHHDVITENKMNKIEDAIWTVNNRISESDNVFLKKAEEMEVQRQNDVNKLNTKDAQLNNDIQNVNRNLTNEINKVKVDMEVGDTSIKNELTEYVTTELENLNHLVNKNEIFANVKQFGAKGDGATDDAAAMQLAIDTCCDDGRSLYIPAGTYKLSTPLKIEKPINIEGEAQHLVILNCSNGGFEIAHENQVTAMSISNMTLKGGNKGIGLAIGKINNVRLADSRFTHIRIERFATGIQSQYAWCNTYDLIRVHGCTQPFAFDSQTNCSHFNTCSFSSFSQTGTFKNCEGLVFTDCNIVNMNTDIGFSLFQSAITFNSPYFENVEHIVCVLGANEEAGNSRLTLNGGIITGDIRISGLNSVLVVNESEMTPKIVKVCNRYDNTTPQAYTKNLFININDTEFTPATKDDLLLNYDGSTRLSIRRITSGAEVPTTLHKGYSKCVMDTASDGFLLYNGIVAGEQYTLVYAMRMGENFTDAKWNQGGNRLGTYMQSHDEKFDLRYLYFTGSSTSALLRLYFQGEIEIAYMKLYKGIRNTVDELATPLVFCDYNPPTQGTWKRGDRIINNRPASGSPKGWICVQDGTPGNWVSEGNL